MVDGCKSEIMKNIIYRISSVLLSVFVLTGCLSEQKEMEKNLSEVVGVWHYSGTEAGVPVDVYVDFSQKSTFDMYVLVGTGSYKHYQGTFSVDTDMNISGVYASGYDWARVYVAKRSGSTLTLSCEGSSWAYEKSASVPQEVKDHSVLTKTLEEEYFF